MALLRAGWRIHVALMPRLANSRHEAFARSICNGTDGTAAYLAVRPKVTRKSAQVEGSRLLSNPIVRARVAELQEAAATVAVLTARERREMLARCARTIQMQPRDLAAVLLADANLAGDVLHRHEQTVDTSRLLSPERRAELLRASIERRKVSDAPGLC